MTAFRGLYPPLITALDDEGRFDEARMRDHVDFMITEGSDGLCAGSSTGEFTTLSRAEWEQVLGVVHEQAAGRVPLLAGSGACSTPETIERSQYAEQLGYDGLLVISPWYQVHTQREVYAHFKALRDAVSIPVMIYNNPAVTGLRLGVPLLERMANDGTIQYVKDADSDPYAIARHKRRVGDRLRLFYGHDNNALGAFAFGATGWVSGTSNFDPRRWSRLVHLCIDEGDFVQARERWYEILPFIELATVGQDNEHPDWIAVIKRGLELRGRPVGPVRPPMLPLTDEVDAALTQVVAAMSFEQAP